MTTATLEAEPQLPRGRRWQLKRLPHAWRRPLALAGIVVVAAWLIVALFAPMIATADPIAQSFPRLQPPGAEHWFGTDGLGRDVFSRVVYGARVSMPMAALLVALSVAVGGLIGAISGYLGGAIDSVIMRIVDLFFAFPPIILAMAVTAALGPGLRNAVIAIVIVSWPAYARVSRSLVLSLRTSDYLAASRLLGASSPKALVREILPNMAGPVLVLATLELGNAVLLLSGLSFLGLGAVPPTPEWGAMVSEGAKAFTNWWIAVFPGLAIFTSVAAFNFLGDSLRDALDPKSSRSIGTARVKSVAAEGSTK